MPDTNRNLQLPLKVKDLCFSVAQKKLVSDFNLELNTPGLTAIMGPNGAGKSLLLRLLHGLLQADSGRIEWNQQPLNVKTRQAQAMVFQKPVLLRRSVAANIDFVLQHCQSSSHRSRREILEEAGLYDQHQQPARLLSGGEQQRLALARALATAPQVLFLDEPTASIDPSTTRQIEHWLEQIRERGVKLIMVTHDIGQARRLASDVVFMHKGCLLEHTNARAFFDTPESAQARAYLSGELIV
ncbi:MAG: ATP-binding cassette domain-containing protein [Gammaproteobacteria bacterium]|nr:ATP-binding cassette domain-containing protein [Gammaproteobacteria bacterium]